MRNILISSSASPDHGSGISSYAKELTESLIRRNIKIHYFSPKPKNWSWIRDHNLGFLESDPTGDSRSICRNLLNYINEHKIDGVINNDNAYLQSVFPILNIPAISVGHLGNLIIASVACHLPEWSDYVIAISNDMQRTFINKYKVPIEKCPVVHNGLNKKADINNFTSKKHKLKIVYSGGFDNRKGADLIKKALQIHANVWQAVELHWFGGHNQTIETACKQNGNVKLHGRVAREKYLEELSTADIFLLPSRREGCPMAMLEAMAYGVVPISSDGIVAMRWLIDSGVEGYICHLHNWPSQLISVLHFLNKNKSALENMKRATYNRFVSQHTMDRTTDTILNLLNNPTVDRSKHREYFRCIKWHRIKNATFIDKVCWRTGYIRYD